MTLNYDNRLAQPIISSDWGTNIFWSDYSESASVSRTITSSANIISNYKSVVLNGYDSGDQILYFMRAQQGGLKSASVTPSVAYFAVNNHLYPIKWAVFPHVEYLAETDKYILTYWGNLLITPTGYITHIADASQYDVSTLETEETDEKEEKKQQEAKDPVVQVATVTKYDNVDARATTSPLTLRTDTNKAILYCVGSYISTYTTSNERVSFFVFTKPVALKIFSENECVIDFHTGGDSTSSGSCRIPYYVS